MEEPTVHTDEVNTEDQLNADTGASQDSVQTSEDTKVWDDKFPKYQKMLPKEYWGDERLARFDSLKSVIEEVLNPKKKAPEKYDLQLKDADFSGKLEDEFKKADLSAEQAKTITDLFGTKLAKPHTEDNLKDVVGLADYEVEKAYVEKAIATICGSNTALKDAILATDSKYDPAIFNFMKVVGKNLGNGTVEPFKPEPEAGKGANDPWVAMVSRPKDYKPDRRY